MQAKGVNVASGRLTVTPCGNLDFVSLETETEAFKTLASGELVLVCECSRGCPRGSGRWWCGGGAGWMAGAGVAPPATNILQLFRMSPLPLPSGVAYGGEVADEQEMVEEEVGSVAQPLSMIVICL